MFAYRSRTYFHRTSHAYVFRPGRDLERSELRNIVLSSSLGEGGSCSSEYDTRTAPKPELFIYVTRLLEHAAESRVRDRGSSPVENGFCSSEANHYNT
jgi:hypothetical protein